MIFRVKNFLAGFRCTVIKNDSKKTSRPVIFAITHIGKYDVEVSAVGIKKHFYLLSGDYEHLQGTVDGAFLQLNGVLYFNEKIKKDREEIVGKMIEHLKQGGNLMYFTEGTWNLTPNLPVLPCYWGIVDVSQKGNAIIIPVAVEQYEKNFKINIGENIDMCEFDSDNTGKNEAITMLRDVLATLKWEIWETERQSRNNIPNDYWGIYVKNRFAEWNYFNADYIDGMIYKPKNIFGCQDVFSHLDNIVPTKSNAFLFNKSFRYF